MTHYDEAPYDAAFKFRLFRAAELRASNNTTYQARRMKLIPSLLAVLAIGCTTSALSQQMVSTPAEHFESPEPTVESTPETKPLPTEAEKPAAPPVSAPKREISAAPPATTRKATPELKPAQKAEPAAPRSHGKMSAEASLKQMENDWEAAIVAHDIALVEGLVASDFSGINSNGKFVNKSALIGELKDDKDTYKSAKNEKLNVHFYGPSTAVVTGSVRSKGTTKGGQSFDRTYRYTDTWVQRNEKWECVASQDFLLGAK